MKTRVFQGNPLSITIPRAPSKNGLRVADKTYRTKLPISKEGRSVSESFGTALGIHSPGAGGATTGREPHLVQTVRKYTISCCNLLTYFLGASRSTDFHRLHRLRKRWVC